MAAVTPERIEKFAQMLWAGLYEEKFRGKDRGRFVLSREQVKAGLGVERLHASTIEALQDAGLGLGLVIVDLDDVFPCVETRVIRQYRRPPTDIFSRFLRETFPEDVEEEDVDEGSDDEE